MSLPQLSSQATQGAWSPRNNHKVGSDIFAGNVFIASFRGRRTQQKIADAEFAAALVNAYRSGRIVER